MLYGRLGKLIFATASVAVFGCDVSHTGLQENDGAGGSVNVGRAGGSGGRAPASGGRAGSGASATGGASGAAGGPAIPPAPPPSPDAADPGTGGAPGSSGINSVDARDARSSADVTGTVADGAGPAVPASKGICQPASDLRLCLTFEGAAVDESSGRLNIESRQVAFEPGLTGLAGRVGGGSALRVEEGLAALGSTSVTLEAWIRPDRLPSGAERAGIIDRDGHYGLFLLPGGALVCAAANGTPAMVSAGIRGGQWASVTCTWGDDGIILWVDGIRRGSASAGARVSGPAAAPLSVGSNSPAGENFEGLIDNVRIWTRQLNATEVCQGALNCGP